MLPDGVLEGQTFIHHIDQALLVGFTNLDYSQQEGLQALTRIFSGTPLGNRVESSLNDLLSGAFQPEAFATLALARAAIQGAQYDRLYQQVKAALGRPADLPVPIQPAPQEKVPPLLDSVRHWLMDIAITGFSRLEPATLTAFFSILTQLQACPEYLRTSALLTGFVDELMAQPEEIPLFRWGDLWSRLMLTTFLPVTTPQPQLVSGTLYPLGLLWREHPRLTSVVIYAVLDADQPQLVKITQSTYKVEAIFNEQIWLLFPQITPLLESLNTGKALQVRDLPLLPGGDLIWRADQATIGSAYKLMEIALQFFAPGAACPMWQLPPAQRHPIHLAEPLALANYQCRTEAEGWWIEAGESSYKIDAPRVVDTEVGITEIQAADHLFGLLRFEAGAWVLQPLSVAKGKGKPIFIGKEGSKILGKPPKDSTVSILKERASRLLRNKA